MKPQPHPDTVTVPGQVVAGGRKLAPMIVMAGTTILAIAASIYSVGAARGSSAWRSEAESLKVQLTKDEAAIVELRTALEKHMTQQAAEYGEILKEQRTIGNAVARIEGRLTK